MDAPAAIDNLMFPTQPGRMSFPTELKYIGKDLALMGAEGIKIGAKALGRGSEGIWNRFWSSVWDSPAKQRTLRHLFILGLIASASYIPLISHPTVKPTTPLPAQAIIMEAQAPPVTVEPLVPSQPLSPIESHTSIKIQENLTDKIFANLTPAEKIDVETSITQQSEIYKTDKERLINTLDWKRTIDAIVEDKRLNIKEEDKQFWKQRMLEVVFVESSGLRLADPANAIVDAKKREQERKVSAKGPGQVLPDTAADLAKRYGIKEYDLQNGWDNLFLALAYRLELAQTYGPELGTWAYHLGPGNLETALKTYFGQVLLLPQKDIDKVFTNPEPETGKTLPNYIQRYQITPFVLLKEPAVTGKLKQINAFGNFTDQYYIRLLAAGRVMGFDKVNLFQTTG